MRIWPFCLSYILTTRIPGISSLSLLNSSAGFKFLPFLLKPNSLQFISYTATSIDFPSSINSSQGSIFHNYGGAQQQCKFSSLPSSSLCVFGSVHMRECDSMSRMCISFLLVSFNGYSTVRMRTSQF